MMMLIIMMMMLTMMVLLVTIVMHNQAQVQPSEALGTERCQAPLC